MAQVKRRLRIYCVCGQKMKVTDKMYGLPGKCIACRQKIRIPARDEVPEGTKELHLKDHPEFVRGPRRPTNEVEEERQARDALDRAPIRASDVDDSTPNTELDLLDDTTPGDVKAARKGSGARESSLALDVHDALRKLASLDYKLQRQLDSLEDHGREEETVAAEVEGHLTRVRKRRAELDDHFHQLLMEVAIELTNTQEKIAQARLSARIGEISYGRYREGIYKLRSRRDRLERRQQNLRGWLSTTTPEQAGGFLDLSVESIPDEEEILAMPADLDDGQSLLTLHTNELRKWLERRGQADVKIDEAKRMVSEESQPDRLDNAVEAAQWEKRSAQANVAFLLGRLERLKKDYATDLETINAQLEVARGRLKVNEIDRAEFDKTEKRLLAAKKDLAKAQTVVTRALSANASGDVPAPRGTFLNRLGLSPERGATPDMALAWVAAALLCIGIFLPAIGDNSLVGAFIDFAGNAGPAGLLFLAPIGLAIAISAATAIEKGPTRAVVLLAAWLTGELLGAYVIRESLYSLNPMAAQFRSTASWLARPGLLALGLGQIGVVVAALMAVWPAKRFRLPTGIAVLIGVIVAGALMNDVGGSFERPVVDVTIHQSDAPTKSGTIRIANAASRPLHLLSRPTDARGSYLFVVERRVGGNSWSDLTMDVLPPNAASSGVLMTIEAGQTEDISFNLGPGEYHTLLISKALDEEFGETFVIDAPEVVEEPDAPDILADEAPANPVAVAEPDEPELFEDSFSEELVFPQVELKGVMTSQDDSTRFSFIVHRIDGTQSRMMLQLGDPVWDDWEVSEFNPNRNTVTLQNGDQILILRRGDRYDLTP